MTSLQRVLRLQAALWAVLGVSLAAAPGWVVESLGGQPPSAPVWIRSVGLADFVLALLMVLVSRRIDDVWWWSWAFVMLQAGTAATFALYAVFDLPPGASPWFWWALVAVHAVVGALELVGLARAGQEQPLVGSP